MDDTNEKKKELLSPCCPSQSDHSAAKIFRAGLLSPVFIPSSVTCALEE